ncbi:DUF5698 domain-containing protein [Acholeplasma sp. OttesenSCG-928-E16]|nr:DUF5698 domain-containing protein [Acholeplasma sp. OttesenSCG-928-E16]
MLQAIGDFFTSVPWWELLLILFAKTIEISLGTLRVILITKGYRKLGTLFSFVEILLWVFIASVVIKDLVEYPIKGLMYAIGFSAGVCIGSLIESKLALGKIFVQTIVTKDQENDLVSTIRNNNYAATTIEAKGRDNEKTLVLVIANRKEKDVLFGLIESICPSAVIVSNDVSALRGGYLKAWRKIAK